MSVPAQHSREAHGLPTDDKAARQPITRIHLFLPGADSAQPHQACPANACGCDSQHMRPRWPTHAAAMANACGRDGKRMRLRWPTHAAAMANACGRDSQRMRSRWQTHAAAMANACGCDGQRMRPRWQTHAADLPRLIWRKGCRQLLIRSAKAQQTETGFRETCLPRP